jgi:hypothetical protein
MSTLPDFKTDAKRDATNSIRGYVYQAYQSVLAWIQLGVNEILVLEGAEDFDIHFGSTVTTTQVKNVAGNLTLRSSDVVDSINNYWVNCERNLGYEIVLHFLATADAGQEQSSPFGSGQKGLEYWRSAEADGFDIEPIRTFLLTLKLESSLQTFIQSASEDELRKKLIRRIKWDLGNGPINSLQSVIENELKVHGLKLGINSHYSIQALAHLLKEIADLLSTKGRKELRFGDFISSFDVATTVSIPRGEMEAMRSRNNLQLLAGMLDLAEMSRLVNRPPTIGRTLPVVDGGIARSSVVSNFSKLLREQRIIFLYGSSGLGKTNLASLISHEVGGNWGWAGFRSMSPDQIKDVLARTAFEMISARLPPFLVLDDVDLSQITQFEREFIALVFSVTSANGMVIITGPTRPPLQLLPKLWKNETSEVSVPYFDETEVAEMVRVHGLTDDKRVSEWARTIWLTTSGHPQLVHARVRNLSAKGWPPIEFTDLINPEDVERVREEARGRLVQEFPSENTRVLAYRLSLTNGSFSRETAIAVAEIPPPTKLPGEAFDELVGPWIEREGEDIYRVSPLLTGAAKNVLSKTEIKAVHGTIALSIVGRKSINQFEVGTAFYHAFMAKHTGVLLQLAHEISITKSENIHLLNDAMSWFAIFGLNAGQRILPENPSVDLMLRLAQYRLIVSSPNADKAIALIARIEESLNAIEQPEIKPHSEALAYGMILNAYEVPIPSSTVIRILSRIIDLSEENSFLREISDSFGESRVAIPRLGENKPAQILFSYQGARLKGLDDLLELVTSLDALPSNKRDQLLRVCSSDMDFASLLINRAWWKDVKDGELDVNKALRVLELATIKSREWKVPELTKAGLVAMSVILDEYGHAIERALDILDAADKEFPDEASLVNQRAKVLFNANRNSEALPIANRALELTGLSNVEFVFCCRNAGIAAAKENNWAEAKRLFLLGAEKAKHSSVQKSMGIGLMADAAFAAWQIKKYENSISTFANVLDSLGGIPLSEDIRIHHLHATVRHCISWIHFDALGTRPADFADPLPGVCSNQEPNERIKDHRIIDIGAAWDLLVSTERILGLSIGIKERGQAVTGGKKSLLMAGYERNVALDVIFMRKDFDNLAPCLIEMLEGLLHAKALKAGDKDEWSIGEIPKLPVGYLDDPKNWELIYLYLVEASVVCTVDQPNMPLPIEQWHSDFAKVCTLPDEANQFLNVLSGGSPNDSLYQQAAAAVFALRDRVLSPADLWKHSFRLLNATMHEKHLVKTALEGLLITRWIFSVGNQRFAFSTPSLACPEIEKSCLDQSLSGLAKVAAVLNVSAPYLNIRLSPDSKQMLRQIIEQE